MRLFLKWAIRFLALLSVLPLFFSSPALAIHGNLVSRSDDSTFLTDQYGGTSLLLPNRNLNGGYQKIDLSGRFKLNSAVARFVSAENVLNEHYTAAFGFPSLPFAIRGGLRITIGGEGWWPR